MSTPQFLVKQAVSNFHFYEWNFNNFKFSWNVSKPYTIYEYIIYGLTENINICCENKNRNLSDTFIFSISHIAYQPLNLSEYKLTPFGSAFNFSGGV